MTNGYRTFVVEDTFAGGMAVQRVKSFIEANNAGNALTPYRCGEGCVAFEVCAHNPLVMSWIEDQLAPFV